MIIDEQNAENVKLISDLYLSSQSVQRNYQRARNTETSFVHREIKVVKRTSDVMLSNEKYTGDVRLLKSGNSEVSIR